MATNKTLIDGVQPTVTTAVTAYTAPTSSGGARVVAFTASLLTGNENYRVFIGDAATVANEIIPARNIAGPNSDAPLELINHIIPAGDSLFVQVSTGTTISFRATGVEF